jgi:uncharacterized protein YndB with AHSA1/START domain
MPQRVEGSIEIEASVETVYGYWETLENLPNFMANVEEVRPTGPDTTHWRSRVPSVGRLSGTPKPLRGRRTALSDGTPPRARSEPQAKYASGRWGRTGPEWRSR